MNIQQPPQTNIARHSQAGKSVRKYKRRHTRVHLDSLKPTPPVLTKDSLSQCPKCHGLIFIDGEKPGVK